MKQEVFGRIKHASRDHAIANVQTKSHSSERVLFTIYVCEGLSKAGKNESGYPLKLEQLIVAGIEPAINCGFNSVKNL